MTDLDVAANVRAADPLTSYQAAAAAREFAGKHADMIHAALCKYGPASKDEIGARLNMDGVAVARRLADLQKRGLAVPTDETRKSRAGRSERVWRVVA